MDYENYKKKALEIKENSVRLCKETNGSILLQEAVIIAVGLEIEESIKEAMAAKRFGDRMPHDYKAAKGNANGNKLKELKEKSSDL